MRNIFVFLIIILIIIFGAYFYLRSGRTANTSLSKISVQKSVEDFYLWYLNEKQSPIKSGTYKTRPDLTSDLKDKISRQKDDPILCALQKPKNITFKTDVKGKEATVQVIKTYADGKLIHKVFVKDDGGRTKLSDINCGDFQKT